MVKAKLHRQNHTQKHMHTHAQKKKKVKKKNIYIYISRFSQSPPPQFGMIRCLFRHSTDSGYISWLWRFNPLLLRLLGEISLSLLFSHSSWDSALDLTPPLNVGCLSASVLCSDRTGLKEKLIPLLWLTQAGRREAYGCGVSLRRQRPAWCCTSLGRAVCSHLEVVPGSRDPGSGGLHRVPGGEVWIVTCACTQASWWLQQQP